MDKDLVESGLYKDDDDVKIWSGKSDPNSAEEDVKIWTGKDEPEEKAPTAKHEKAKKSKGLAAIKGKRIAKSAGRTGEAAKPADALSRRNLVTVAAAALLFALVWFFPQEGKLKTVGLILVYIAAAFDVLFAAADSAMKKDFRDESLPVFTASIAAMAIREFAAGILIVLLYRICRIAGQLFNRANTARVERLRAIRPVSTNAETKTGTMTVGPEYVRAGNVIHVEPGERIALDGRIIEGMSSIDVSELTGDGATRSVGVGSRVFAGTVNLTEKIIVRVSKSAKKSTAVKALDFIENAPKNKAAMQLMAERAEKYCAPALALIAVLTAVVPPLFGGAWTEWIKRGIIILAISSPRAIVAGVAKVYEGALSKSAENGIICKGADRFEKLSKTATVALDKTGTLTDGRFKVTEVFPAGISEEALLSIAATAEGASEHPIALAIKAAGKALTEPNSKMLEVEEIPGRGVSAFIGKRHVYVGNAALLEEHGISCAMPSRPGTAIHVAMDNRYCGHILISDALRNGTFETIDKLRSLGVSKLVMLTGDVLSVARPLANKLNFDMMRSELRTEEKFAALAYLTDNAGENSTVAFVTSGENDELLLSRADVGIALDALGKDGLFDEADIIIPGNDIKKVALSLQTAKRAESAAQTNLLALPLGRLLAVILTMTGTIPLSVAVICAAALELATVANAAGVTALHTQKTEKTKRSKRIKR